MKRRFLLILIILPLSFFAQKKETEKVYKNYLSLGAMVHTFGLGATLKYKRDVAGVLLGLTIDLAGQKSKKEQKINSRYESGDRYVWDKKNYLYKTFIGLSVGKKVFGHSSYNKTVIFVTGSVGPVLGFLKPYYVKIVPSGPNSAPKPVEYDAQLYTYDDIYGQADYFLGFDQLSINPGLSLRFSGELDFSKGGNFIRGVELIVYSDIFFREVEIFDERTNPKYFVGGGIALYLGNAW